VYKFEGNALAWWKAYKQAKGGDAWLVTVTWVDFKKLFFQQFFPRAEQERLKREYHSIRQTSTETSTEFMQRFLRLVGFLGAAAGTEEEQAKNFQWGLRRSTLNHLMCMSYMDVAQVANDARNYEILHERDNDDTERPDKRQRSGDRHQPTSQQSSHMSHGHNNDRHGSDRRGGNDNHRDSNNNNYSCSNNKLNFKIYAMVNTRTDVELSAVVQNALQTLLPQIRAEIREEFRTSSGPSDSGGNPPPVTIHTWLELFNKQKPRSFEKATALVDAKNWISHMEKIFDVMGCEDAFKTRLAVAAVGNAEEQAKNFQWGLRRSTLNHLMCIPFTDVAQVVNAARNYEMLHERDDDDTERPDKKQKSGDRHQPTTQQSSHRNHGHNNDRHGSDRRGGGDNHNSNNNHSGHNNRSSGNGRDQRNRGQQSNRPVNSGF
nr:zinc finger, CCHC-type, retrotransposon Gag domain protein [Tanacetum cinerariifolium]